MRRGARAAEEPGGNVLRELVADGNVLATWGVGAQGTNPDGSPNFVTQANFDPKLARSGKRRGEFRGGIRGGGSRLECNRVG